ncbi:substrate-binding domain-containing protein, partial [Streptomyces ipomoeae]|uniref:substrate-binding domain-containing protein n=1 Tax=Streptomyces ipomoeae TaxID=103232 RepID=UPI0029A5822A
MTEPQHPRCPTASTRAQLPGAKRQKPGPAPGNPPAQAEPTAVFVCSDKMALGVYEALAARGLR